MSPFYRLDYNIYTHDLRLRQADEEVQIAQGDRIVCGPTNNLANIVNALAMEISELRSEVRSLQERER